MFSVEKLLKKITIIKKDNNNIFEKNLNKDMLLSFHKIIRNICKKSDLIIKGGRALNANLDDKIYSKDDILYADYDIYSQQAKETILSIGKSLEENNYPYIEIKEIAFKEGIYQLKLYNIPFIDIENVDEKIYKKLPYNKINNIKYIDPRYMKIDLYSIIARPTYYNIQLWSKTLNRLAICEDKYSYKKGLIRTRFTNKYIEEIINVLDQLNLKDIIFTGNYAYNKLIGKIEVDHLDILINVDYHVIKKIKKILEKKGKTFYKKFQAYTHVMHDHYTIHYKNKLSLIIWPLNNCSGIINIDGRNYTNKYFLKFFYNFLKYSKVIYPHLKDYNYYDAILNSIDITELPKADCIGDVNPGVEEYKKFMFFRKNKTFKYSSINN